MVRSTIWMVPAFALGLTSFSPHTMAASPFDGVYSGPMNLTSMGNPAYCHPGPRAQLAVTDGVIKFKWGNVPLETTVAADGSFSVDRPGYGPSPVFSLKGRITGGNLEADVGATTCAAHLSLKKG